MSRVPTIDLKGKDYATVPARLKIFREENPNGKIDTEPTVGEDGGVIFRATILKDKSNPHSAEATGHAMGGSKGDKDFEKLETIAVGRALALLGYAASGEIASSEEMERFNEYRNDQIEMAIDTMKAATTVDELKQVFMGLGTLMAEKKIITAKDTKKRELLDEDSGR